MMGSSLRLALRSLCFNTEWKYAVFWKLKHCTRMVLTCEDVYYDYCEENFLDNKCLSDELEIFHDSHYLHDPLGFAVAKMSCHVYSIGEGIVGQVAVTGKHLWYSADKRSTNSFLSLESSDEWQTQFRAGIRTAVVVAVVPHGVVQLGSLNKVTEDLKVVNHIKNVFQSLQGSSMGCISNPTQHKMRSFLVMPEVLPQSSCSEVYHDKPIDKERSNVVRGSHSSYSGGKEIIDTTHPNSVFSKAIGLYNLFEESSQVGPFDSANFYHEQLGGIDFCQGGVQNTPYMQQEELEIKPEQETDLSCIDSINTSLQFSGCSELHEVLGSAFFQPNTPSEFNTDTAPELPRGMGRNQLVSDYGSDNLLEAVVASVCQTAKETQIEKSFCQSMQSLLTTEKRQQASSHVKHSDSPTECLGFSSTCPSECSEQLERSTEPVKTKKRGRVGEACRPRPRDRQLIQDRIKELRELVPNGSKCSIDSLLERTIKHMLFMQSITKYTDKMTECAELKLCNKERSLQGSSTNEQGLSWAVEVGSQLKVYPIVVENLNMNGQLLIEMLCEECSNFLEIAEAIRSLGLAILKGVTENCGQKTRMCFVVEGQNRTIHRTDVLRSLVQMLQPKATV